MVIAWEDFAYAIGSNLDSQACPAGTCGGWQTNARTPGTTCDGTQTSLGDTGPNWLLGPNSDHSKIVADFASLPAGLTSLGHAVSLDDRIEQNRLFRAIDRSVGSNADKAGLLAPLGDPHTVLDLAGHPFIEKGVLWMTYVGNESAADGNPGYCGGHFQRGVGASSCMTGVKTNEHFQFGTNNTFNNWSFMRVTQGASQLGPSSWLGATPLNTTPHEFTLKFEFGVSDACSSPDSNNLTVTCPACPIAGVNCRVAITAWLDATPDANGDPSQAPYIARKVVSNWSNVSGVQGGFSIVELGCVGPSQSSQANNGQISHLALAVDDPVTHHGGFEASRMFQ